MVDKRPKELVEKLDAIASENDKNIVAALDEMEAMVANGEKPGLEKLAEMASVSVGTIRGRDWALARYKAIKIRRKSVKKHDNSNDDKAMQLSETNLLKERIKSLLTQNAVLYEEVLGLQSELTKRDREIEVLKRRLGIKAVN